MFKATGRERVKPSQGSTLLWTEGYGRTRLAAAETLRDVAFVLALALLTAGTLGFLGLGRPAARASAAPTAARAL